MKAVVLLSGGLDSTVAAWLAAREMELVLALTCDYGQRAAEAEIRAAGEVASALAIPQRVVPLGWVGAVADDALTSSGRPLPHPTVEQLTGDDAETSAAAVWVPNRNGLLVNVAAVYAEPLGCQGIVCGFNAEEAATFSDNSQGFVNAANVFFAYSTRGRLELVCPTLEMTKVQIVRIGREVGAPLDLVWSCYEAGPQPCWRCESCVRLRRALDEAG